MTAIGAGARFALFSVMSILDAVHDMFDKDRDGTIVDDATRLAATAQTVAATTTAGAAIGGVAGNIPGAIIGGAVGAGGGAYLSEPAGALGEEWGDFVADVWGMRTTPRDGWAESDDRHYRRQERGLGMRVHDRVVNAAGNYADGVGETARHAADLWSGWMDD